MPHDITEGEREPGHAREAFYLCCCSRDSPPTRRAYLVMNPYAANFQVPVPSPAPTTTRTAATAVGLADEGNGEDQEAAWAEDPSQRGDGAGGYWDEHGQHHPGYGGDYDPAVYHPDGYDPTYHHQVGGQSVIAFPHQHSRRP